MQAIRNMEPAWEKVNGAEISAQAKNHQSAWEKVHGRKFALKQRTISQHGRKLLRENFTSVHKIYPLAPCSLPPAPKEAELPKVE